jgi:dinuclear metal center YbgI/SA1388 family protein
MQTLKEIINVLETFAPLDFQEEYDNCGLVYGHPSKKVDKAITALDLNQEVLDEAISISANLIIVHHPPIFKGLKRFAHNDPTTALLIQAIKMDIAIYACHTNLDNVIKGVNGEIADRLGLKKIRVLQPKTGTHHKLITYVPLDHLEIVRNVIFDAGAGKIGNYAECSFTAEGNGTFKALDGANPFVGEKDILHHEKEHRLEVMIPCHLSQKIIYALKKAHPYETVAYDILPLNNTFDEIGAGIFGELPVEIEEKEFLFKIKNIFNTGVIKHNNLRGVPIKRVALCGGSGKSLINRALKENADVYLTADLGYHDFFIPGSRMLLADIGHFESEQFTSDRLLTILKEKFPNFAVLKSGVNTNPVNYFL